MEPLADADAAALDALDPALLPGETPPEDADDEGERLEEPRCELLRPPPLDPLVTLADYP